MNETKLFYDSYLAHYGVKGMKWGVRRYQNKRSNVNNEDYSDKQRKRDIALYGKRAEKRINKRLNEGHGLQGARHYEVERKERSEKTKSVIKRGAKKTAALLGTVGSMYISDQLFNDGRTTKMVTNAVKNTVKRAGNIR